MATEPKITQQPKNEEQDLADAIRAISKGMDSLSARGLNRRAIVVLLKSHTSVPMVTIDRVLDGLSTLAKAYTK